MTCLPIIVISLEQLIYLIPKRRVQFCKDFERLSSVKVFLWGGGGTKGKLELLSWREPANENVLMRGEVKGIQFKWRCTLGYELSIVDHRDCCSKLRNWELWQPHRN